jgi:hypothetical protein
MNKYIIYLLGFVLFCITSPTAFALSQNVQLLDTPQLTYLEKVYPLADKNKFNQTFFDSLHFYWYDPSATGAFFKNVATEIKLDADPAFICLGWMVGCEPKGPVNGVVRNQYPLAQNTPTLKGASSNQLVEVYHNGWYQEPGLYFYVLKGTGVFLNVGKTLIARNKVDALHKMGLSDVERLRILTYYLDGSTYVPTYDAIAQYADTHDLHFDQALILMMKQAREGTNYLADRFNATASCDFALYLLAREKGYDTVQLTNQGNINGGWGYEIVDVRANISDSLEKRWIKERQYLFLADPFDTKKRERCQLEVPFKMVQCDNYKSLER